MADRLANGFVSSTMPRITGLRCCWPLLLLHLLSATVFAQTQSQSEMVGVNQAIEDSVHLNAQGKYNEAIAVTRKAIDHAEN